MKRISVVVFWGLLSILPLFSCQSKTPTPTPTSGIAPIPSATKTTGVVPNISPIAGSTLVPDLGLYLIVDVTGTLSHKRPGWHEYLPLTFGTAVNREDLLQAAPDAHGLIVCADLTLVEVQGDYYGGLPCPLPEQPPLRFGEDLIIGPRRDTPLSTKIPYILSPRRTFIRTSNPVIRWSLSSSGTMTYTVRVSNRAMEWETTVTGAELAYPDNAPILEPGVHYYIEVTDNLGHSSAEEKTSLNLAFALLPPERNAAVDVLVAQAHDLEMGNLATLLVVGEIYAAQQLRADAISVFGELDSLSDAPTVDQRLGDLYLEVGLYKESLGAYERALQGYQDIGDKAGEAVVLAGIGLAYRGERDDKQARTYLTQALEIYEEIGDSDRVPLLEDVLETLR